MCDAFGLDVNVVNFVYYGKTRLVELETGTYRAATRSDETRQADAQPTELFR